MKKWLVAIAVVGTLSVAQISFGEDPQSDFAKMQGTWRGTSQVGAALNLTIDGNTFKTLVKMKSSARGKGGSYTVEHFFTIDETSNPKEIDFHVTEENGEEKLVKAIYKLKGDKLTVCMDQSGKKRPTKFDGSNDGGTMVIYNRYPAAAKPSKAAPEGRVTANSITR
jgi:uncharacterized protein (TIGR03067 family)